METRARPVAPRLKISRLTALRAFRRHPISLLERAARLGDVVRVRMPGFDAFLVNHPDLVWEVLVAHHRDVGKGPSMQAAKRLIGENLLTSDEPIHMRQRHLMNPLFHHDRISSYGATMVEHAARRSERWRPEELVDVREEMAALTLGIVGSTIFATEVGTQDGTSVRVALTDILSMFDDVYSPLFPLRIRLPLPATRRFERRRAEIEGIVLRMIEERRRTGATGTDLLSLLLRAQEDGYGMSDEQVRNEALTLFLAGHETTANALTWTWWLLSEHPKAEAELHAELDRVLDGRSPRVADLRSLPFTEAVISESLRLRPPAWAIGRRVHTSFELGGSAIPQGAVLVVSPWLLHHDDRWFPEPDAFRPERWISGEAERRPRGAFLPFGAGPRQCIGEGFALMEARLVLATIAGRWRLRLVPGRPVSWHPAITLRPSDGMPMRPEPRWTP